MKWYPLNFVRFFPLFLLVTGTSVRATVFNIDASQSQITLSGKIDTHTFTAQAPGSLTTAYFGFVNVVFSGTNIQFTGSGAVIATTNGNWKPFVGGSPKDTPAPANYGATATVLGIPGYGAGRNIILDISSSPAPIVSTNFDSSTIAISLPTNGTSVFDYFDALGNGTQALTGTSTNAVSTSSIVTNNNVIRLTIKIDTIITDTSSTTLHLVGTLTATNGISAPVPPPVIAAMSRTNGNFVLTVSNALPPCQLLSSTNLATWTTVPATSNVVNGLTLFTVPINVSRAFFRIQK